MLEMTKGTQANKDAWMPCDNIICLMLITWVASLVENNNLFTLFNKTLIVRCKNNGYASICAFPQ